MPNRFDFMGLPLDAITLDETVERIEAAIRARQCIQHTVINAAKVVHASGDVFLRQSIVTSDIVNADGQAIVWAGRWLGIPVPERVTGVDLMGRLLALASAKSYRVFFLGAEQSVLEKLVAFVQENYPGVVIAGARNGYFNRETSAVVAEEIKAARPDMLFVGMPTPRKENFIHAYHERMALPFSMGVGGSFDIYAGKTRRAPLWMQRAGLEWLYRLLQEPRRMFKRYANTNLHFIYLVFKFKLSPQKARGGS